MASFTQLDIINKSFLETRSQRGAKDQRSRLSSRTSVESPNLYEMDKGVLIRIDSKMGPIHSPLVPTNRQPPSHIARRPVTTNELQLGIKNQLASFGTLGSKLQSP
jgi:hypothetical protein